LKVVHVISGLSTGGAERALYNLLQGGLGTEFDNHVISLNDAGTIIGPQIEALGVPVTALGMNAGKPSITSLSKLRKTIKVLQPDLIQGWMYHGNLAATLARSVASQNVALIWNIRQSLYKIKDNKLLTRQIIRANRFFSNSPDALLYNSQLSQQQHEAFGYAATHGKVIPNGIDLQRFIFSEDSRQRLRAELSIPLEALVIGHVARLHPMKDHSGFLQAAEIIIANYPDVHFVLIGKDVSLDNTDLKQQIPSPMQNNFHLLGERSDVADLMSAMDIFCQSSWSEAFPNVLGEAMAVGVPCVATDVGDSAFILGESGIMVPPRDPTTLSEGLETLLALPFTDLKLLGVQARKRIENKFALDAIVKIYSSCYKKQFEKIKESKR